MATNINIKNWLIVPFCYRPSLAHVQVNALKLEGTLSGYIIRYDCAETGLVQ